jgi:hypothetical protein
MVNATPEGKHMEMDIFYQSLDFIKRMRPMVVLVSGGEPTEHPQICKIIREIKQLPFLIEVVLISNGHFLFNKELTEQVLNLGVPIQVTYDQRYYPVPIPLDKIKHPQIALETEIRHIYPLGRAVTNNIKPYNTIAPKCFNLRSIARNCFSFKDCVQTLESYSKFCTPSINIDGSISSGESNLCCRIGSVTSLDKELYDNLISMRCNRCGMEDKLDQLHRKAISLD